MDNTLTENSNWSFVDASHYGLKQRGKYNAFRKVNFINAEKFLGTFSEGFTLNACCGLDPFGDVLMDVDIDILKKVMNHRIDSFDKEYIQGDVKNLPFREKSFDTVICDPPFSFYNRVKWVFPLKDLARQKLILCTAPIDIKIRDADRELYAIDGSTIFLRLWYVFTNRGA